MAAVKPPCFLCHATSDDLEYYKLPASREVREAWVTAVGAAVDTVCSAHFVDDDYCHMRGRRRLRASAVPSRLLARKSPPPTVENESRNGEKSESTDTTDITKTTETTDNTDNTETAENTETTENTKKKKTKKSHNKKSKKSTNKNPTTTTTSLKEAVNEKEAETKKNAICVKENGNDSVSTEIIQNEEKDIEDMITNYQIKQTKSLADRLKPEPLEELIPAVLARTNEQTDKSGNKSADKLADKSLPLDSQAVAQLANRLDSQLASRLAHQSANKLDEQLGDGELLVELEPDVMVGVETEPVFIEVSVDKDPGSRAASPQDCLMLLESVQCEVDPSSLMLPEHEPETDSDMEIVDTRKDDPISLLTSSDEDEVIIQEPHIDTVDVSDETDEDDRPLQRFVKPKQPPKPKKPVWLDGLAKSLMPKLQYHWGVYQYYCEMCNFRTESDSEIKQHMKESEHTSIPLQVCPTCNYSTGSKAQFARHRRKHKDERNYKCHLCHYKARHNMSLMYHLKSHQPKERNPAFVCDKCGFSTDVKSEGLNHIKACIDWVVFRCDQCSYSTKRRSDLKRHRQRRHSIDDDDADFTV